MVSTKKVQGRRRVRYESFDDLLSEARQFSEGEVRSLGNWSQGQIYEHLARSLDASIDGMGMSFPAPLRWMMTLLMKRKFLEEEIPAGFSSPGKYCPEETSAAEGLASLQRAIARQAVEPERIMHPGLGHIGRDGWDKFHLRHAELHMSFLIPEKE